MKRWAVAVLFSVAAGCPAVSIAADDTYETGRAVRFTFPLIKIPFGAGPDTDVFKKKENAPDMKEEDREARRKAEERAKIDKKIDDAINKAWGREATER